MDYGEIGRYFDSSTYSDIRYVDKVWNDYFGKYMGADDIPLIHTHNYPI